jgi:class 3 adenylate cyclase/tetratricopeptide (TPR) repeat protein
MQVERKLATVLFIDLVDSTGFVSGTDPEVVRRRVTGFFDQVAQCVETHGGIVEKFAGDAVMAAFGIPLAHEDDAERAVRAALAMLDSVHELGLEARVGIESGEVVADESDSTFATGEAVNLAARLQQTASPGEVLIGAAAHGLTVGLIETEELGPVPLRGREAPLWTWRVLGISGDARVRPLAGAQFVGRAAELELLENTWDRALRSRHAHLFTVYGEPGVGKSRLAAEFSSALEGATVLKGRALPYGEGITYWPLAEMVKTASGISDDDPVVEAVSKLRATCEDEAVADLLALASGVLEAVEGERSQQEIAWAAREFVEQLAGVQPLVMLFEDIHWAEEPLLELIEHLAAWVKDSPVLLVCLARPELLDVRPGWGGGRLRATAIELEPLARDESEELFEALIEATTLSSEIRTAVLEKTEGNPLFVEETVRMLAECDVPEAPELDRIPDSLQALIAARIDRLPGPEKALLQRAAVVGRVFWSGALEHLSRDLDPSEVEHYIDDLHLRDFVLREPRTTISGERAFRFKHVLIREVAYSGLSKSSRADLHRRFADWLHERVGEELLEIRAFHLDRAASLLAELDGTPPKDLAGEAAAALEEAGTRALAREAHRAGRALLVRAVELEPTLERRYHAARAAWRLTDYPAVAAEMELVRESAAKVGDRRLEGRALTALSHVAMNRDADLVRAKELAEQALETLEDSPGRDRFDALDALAATAKWIGDLTTAERIHLEQLEIARATDRTDLEVRALHALAFVYFERLEPDRAMPLLERAGELAEETGSILGRAGVMRSVGKGLLMRGDLEGAEDAIQRSRALFGEAGADVHLASTLLSLSQVAVRKDELPRAEKHLREAIRILKPLGDRGTLCEAQRQLAQVLVREGKLEEAELVALEARETVGTKDHGSRASTRMALGMVRAAQGRDEEAEALLREALEILDGTELLLFSVEPLEMLVQFLRERGRDAEAVPFARRLLELAPAAGLATSFEASAEKIA